MTPADKAYAVRCIQLVHDLAALAAPTLPELAALLTTSFSAHMGKDGAEWVGAPTALFSQIVFRSYPGGGGVLSLGPPAGILIPPSAFLPRPVFGAQTKHLRDLYAPDGGASNTFFALNKVRLCVETGYMVQFFRRFSLEWRARTPRGV